MRPQTGSLLGRQLENEILRKALGVAFDLLVEALSGDALKSDPIGLAGGRNTYIYVKDNPLSRTDRRGLGGPGVAGTGVDDILQNTPDSKCDYWPALCIAKVIVCTEATCTYTDCHGKPFVMEDISFLPTPPNRGLCGPRAVVPFGAPREDPARAEME